MAMGYRKKMDDDEDDDFDEIKYSKTTNLEEFRKDWEECRDRHSGQKEVLRAFFDDKKRYIFLRAGRKFSKTTCMIDIAWRFAMEHPRSIIYFCYPYIEQGIDVIWDEGRLQSCDTKDYKMEKKYLKFVDFRKYSITFTNGSKIKIIGTMTAKRGRGTQPDLLLVDEIQDCEEKYLDAMDPNLAAKNGWCIMAGTPPEFKNHYHIWEQRIKDYGGVGFHFSSYANDKLPHLKDLLDKKKAELCGVGREDIWRREYMAEDCFITLERYLPNVQFKNQEEIKNLTFNPSRNERKPFIAISIHPGYFCAILGYIVQRICVVCDYHLYFGLWQTSYENIFRALVDKKKALEEQAWGKMKRLVWDPGKSWNEFILDGFVEAREDLNWKDRGFPLLREMINTGRILFSDKMERFNDESQKLFIDETKKLMERDYPVVATVAMMVNEYFNPEDNKKIAPEVFDKYEPIRKMGLPCPTHKKRGTKLIFSRTPT